jgi:hypothetical protein
VPQFVEMASKSAPEYLSRCGTGWVSIRPGTVGLLTIDSTRSIRSCSDGGGSSSSSSSRNNIQHVAHPDTNDAQDGLQNDEQRRE